MSHRFEGIPSACAIGDFLRNFEPTHLNLLNEYLTRQALAARKHFAPDTSLILDMDSTSHIQSGKQIEGLAVNYKSEISLESLDCFDELGFCYGFCYGFYLRDGATFSSAGAGAEIERIFSHLDYQTENHFRADSAYCNEEVMRALKKARRLRSQPTAIRAGKVNSRRSRTGKPGSTVKKKRKKLSARKESYPSLK
jgi:hypothetical protein